MGQCVTNCKNPSLTLGSKNGDPDSSRAGHWEEQVPPCGKPGGDTLVNETKKAAATTEACQLPTSSGDTGRESRSNAEESSLQRLEELFRHYKDKWEDAILEEGMECFCNDLCVDPTEFQVLLLAWKFQAATMSLTEAKQEDKFKDLYWFTFQFGQQSLHREIAIALWKLNSLPMLDQGLNFLTENPSGIKGISWDTWNMFLNFTQGIGPDLSNYSEDEAWPSLFDSFVEKKEGEGRGALSSGPRACYCNYF
uniref:DCN1-like protein n=1 Tax=Cavia porcellus TaxID=10141 RepID=A0A286XV99_CAVPO